MKLFRQIHISTFFDEFPVKTVLFQWTVEIFHLIRQFSIEMTSLLELYITTRRFFCGQWFHETFLQSSNVSTFSGCYDATPDAEVNLKRKRALCKQENPFWTDPFWNKNFESSLGALLKQEKIINRTLLFWDNELALILWRSDADAVGKISDQNKNWVRETLN